MAGCETDSPKFEQFIEASLTGRTEVNVRQREHPQQTIVGAKWLVFLDATAKPHTYIEWQLHLVVVGWRRRYWLIAAFSIEAGERQKPRSVRRKRIVFPMDSKESSDLFEDD